MTYLEAIRAIATLADERGPLSPVDADLDREAGMSGNLARLLQAARDLDAAGELPVAAALATAGRTPQEAAAEALAATLTTADVPAEHIGAGVIETWIDVTDGEHEGVIRLHVTEDGAEVTVATTYYDPADEDQPGRPVEDQEHGTFPVTSLYGILYCLRVLAEEHGAT